MTYFDANTWVGRWPFSFADVHTPRSLAAHLGRHGIRRALVSPLDAVFAPAPQPANLALLTDTRGHRGLVPIPVINPALAGWHEDLAAVAQDARVRAVRLLPNYHDYKLDTPAVDELLAELQRRRLRLIVQMQLIDHRHEYHALTIKPVPPGDLAGLLKRRGNQPVLASGLMRTDILKLAPRHPNLLADLSFAEWHDTLEHLLAKVLARQLAFASHTPLLITAAARAKLDTSTLTPTQCALIATTNLERFLRL
jgi:predicted TIM-barrel fold metal-dependent hydrolase